MAKCRSSITFKLGSGNRYLVLDSTGVPSLLYWVVKTYSGSFTGGGLRETVIASMNPKDELAFAAICREGAWSADFYKHQLGKGKPAKTVGTMVVYPIPDGNTPEGKLKPILRVEFPKSKSENWGAE